MKQDALKKMITASRMYYEESLTQEAISERLGISVPQVSRLITQAKRDGYIDIQVIDPFRGADDLSERLLKTFPLKDARVVEGYSCNSRVTNERVAKAAADYLMDILHPNDVVGVAFSDIISRLPNLMRRQHIDNVFFVQMTGVISEHVTAYQNDTVRAMAAKVDGFYYFFPTPILVEDKYVRDSLHKDPIVRQVLNTVNRANIALFGVNAPDAHSPLVMSNYLTAAQMDAIRSAGAVGDLFGHFIDSNGALCNAGMEDRLPGMSPLILRDKEYSICVAADSGLADVVLAAIKGGYCNLLITDTDTAEKLLTK